jgi:hypothetical protein
MTSAEKLTMLKSLLNKSGTDSDTLLGSYLTLAQKEIISWRYGSTGTPDIAKATPSNKYWLVRVNAPLFIAKLTPTSGTSYVFTYSLDTLSWQYASADVDLSDYGITYYGLPVGAETITVKYSEVPLVQFDTVQIMAVVAGYGLQGAENQTNHNENGIQRSFKYSDMVDYIRAHVSIFCGIL